MPKHAAQRGRDEVTPGQALVVSTLTTSAELSRVEGEWRTLLERTGHNLPFVTPEWLVTWWETFRQDRRLIRDSLCVKMVRRRSGDLAGVVPFMMTERPSFGLVRTRALTLLGRDEYITEQRAPVVDPRLQGEVAQALAAHLSGEEWDWITWEGLDVTSDFATTLERLMGLRWGQAESSNVLRLAPTWEEFRSGLKRSIKESLRHCYNSLKRDGLSARLVVAEGAAEVDAALDSPGPARTPIASAPLAPNSSCAACARASPSAASPACSRCTSARRPSRFASGS